ncbi:MAG TPA: hypothetical protein VGC99_01110, partial [Candidatus Tectomicrobia bacterium]
GSPTTPAAHSSPRRLQNRAAAGPDRFEAQRRYIRHGRDLGEYVYVDALYQEGGRFTLTRFDGLR